MPLLPQWGYLHVCDPLLGQGMVAFGGFAGGLAVATAVLAHALCLVVLGLCVLGAFDDAHSSCPQRELAACCRCVGLVACGDDVRYIHHRVWL